MLRLPAARACPSFRRFTFLRASFYYAECSRRHSSDQLHANKRELTTPTQKIQIAVVGSGPSGCFVASALTKQNPLVHVDVFERLPVPFGLCRYGVSPDHPDVKNVEKQMMDLFKSGRVTWMGNIQIGRDVPVSQLLKHYAGVVFSTGADRSATLDIPGRDLAGVVAASDVVSNYNTLPHPHGSPRFSPIAFDRATRVTVVGNGNVAMDIVRVLAATYQYFAPTDMNCCTVRELMKNHIQAVDVIARRGVQHSAFSTASFRELTQLEQDRVSVEVDAFSLEEAIQQLPPRVNPRAHRRLMDLVHQFCVTPGGESRAFPLTIVDGHEEPPNLSQCMEMLHHCYMALQSGEKSVTSGAAKRQRGACHIRFRYGLTPVQFLPHPLYPKANRLGGVLVRCSVPAHDGDTPQYAVLPCDVAIQSLGYHGDIGNQVDDLPVDPANGRILNQRGRVQGLPRVYCSGWAKNGSKGVIVHSLNDAQETAKSILEDIHSKVLPLEAAEQVTSMQGKFGLLDYFIAKQLEPVSVAGLERIFYVEKNRGIDLGKRMEKMAAVRDMLDVALGGEVGKRTADHVRGMAGARPQPLLYLKELLDDETDLSSFARSFAKDLPRQLAERHPPGPISPSQL